MTASNKIAINYVSISYNLIHASPKSMLAEQDIDRIIQMAWEDRTPFEAIEAQFGLKEKEVIATMRTHMKRSSFEMWRKRMNGRSTKHQSLRTDEIDRFHCSRQRTISHNKIAKH